MDAVAFGAVGGPGPSRCRRCPRTIPAGRRQESGSASPGGAAAGGVAAPRGQPVVQETVGQVQLPLCWMVTPQLLPLPLGLAVSTWALG